MQYTCIWMNWPTNPREEAFICGPQTGFVGNWNDKVFPWDRLKFNSTSLVFVILPRSNANRTVKLFGRLMRFSHTCCYYKISANLESIASQLIVEYLIAFLMHFIGIDVSHLAMSSATSLDFLSLSATFLFPFSADA